MPVYLVIIGWLYVVLMMSVAEATHSTGTLLGAIVTFFLYGLGPVALVVYLMRTPQRRKAIRAREATEDQARREALASNEPADPASPAPSDQPDAGGHSASAAQAGHVPPVGKED